MNPRESHNTDAKTAKRSDPLVGRTLNGKYAILALHASGGMGRIYRAEQKMLERIVAVKVLSLSDDQLNATASNGDTPSRQFAQRFFREASILAKLQHPNIVTVFDYGRLDEELDDGRSALDTDDQKRFFTVMEFLDGETLAKRIRSRGRIPVDEAVDILKQILRGLRVAHQAGIVHRDLKPSNLILISNGESEEIVKIVDFGIVKVLGVKGKEANDEELTREGVFVGSPRYMSPEQVMGKRVDARSDLYAVGLIAYQMLTGEQPVEGTSTVETMLAQVSQEPKPFRDVSPPVSCPEWLESLVFWCLRKRPDERPQSCDEVLRALRTADGSAESSREIDGTNGAVSSRLGRSTIPSGTSFPAASEDGPPTIRPPSQRRSRVGLYAAAGGAIIVLLALAGAGLALRSARGPASSPPSAQAALSVAAVITSTPAAASPSSASYRLEVTSNPAGAMVYDGEAVVGRTPLDLPIVNESLGATGRALILRLDGYEPYRVDVMPSQRDVTMGVALVPAATPASARPHGSAASAPAGRPRAETPRANASAAAAKGSSRPAMAEPASTNGLRPLDDANPWEKR